jgi:hypothetical protein
MSVQVIAFSTFALDQAAIEQDFCAQTACYQVF